MSFLRGPPPKVIWIRRGNCTTADIKALLRSSRTEILAFGAEAEAAFLALS
jgi:predicted nuclease of predicted toxin-antitoxin system